jgi:hypothetical protein
MPCFDVFDPTTGVSSVECQYADPYTGTYPSSSYFYWSAGCGGPTNFLGSTPVGIALGGGAAFCDALGNDIPAPYAPGSTLYPILSFNDAAAFNAGPSWTNVTCDPFVFTFFNVNFSGTITG